MENTEKRCVLITGAAGGMGSCAAKLLSEKGYTVFALDKNPCEEGENIIPVTADLSDPNSVEQAFAVVKEKTDTLFAVIHFAGIYELDSLLEITEKRWTDIFGVNLFGAYRVNKTFLPLLKKGSRIIITTSELAPLYPLPFTGIYAITKTALEKYAFSLRSEVQLLGIGVSVIRPGAVNTGLLPVSTKKLDDFCKNTKTYAYNAAKFRKIVNGVEAKSIPPEKIARTALKAITARRPKYVYNINRNKLLRLLNILPAKWQTKIIGRILKNKAAD